MFAAGFPVSCAAFVSRQAAPKTKEQKKVSSLAKRQSTRLRESRKSGPVTVITLR